LATAQELTDPHLSIYVPPPRAGRGVCRVCHGSSSDYARCWSCKTNREKASNPLDLVVPISLTRTDMEAKAQLHNVLRDYKYADDPEVRAEHRLLIAATLLRFLTVHESCIEGAAGKPYDTITVVPSKRGRAGAHPLEQAIALAPPLEEMHERLLEPGPGTIGRNAPVDNGFTATTDAQARSVLLIDDTLTSGAKLQSAASALALGGATVVAGVVLGRVIDVNVEKYPERAEFWKRQAETPFDFGTCCLE
jgi:predicted amidophosphoribosyltransferase